MLKWFRRRSIETLIEEGEYEQAIEQIRAELALDLPPPRSRPLKQLLGETLGFLGRTEEAIAVLKPLAREYLAERHEAKAIVIHKLIQSIEDPDALEAEARVAAIAEVVGKRPPAASQASPEAPVDLNDPIDLAELQDDEEPGATPASAGKVAGNPLFQSFSPDELPSVVRGFRLKSLYPGEVVMIEGEPGNSLYLLTDGTVRIYVKQLVGRSVQIREIRAPAFFGEVSIVLGTPRTATITCKTRCELLELDAEAVDRIAAEHPRVRDVLKEFCAARAASDEELKARQEKGAEAPRAPSS